MNIGSKKRQTPLPYHVVSLLCALVAVLTIVGFGSATNAAELLSNEIIAEIKVEVTVMKAGPGSAYIDRGRLYKGDLVRILAKENLTDWVRVRAGKLEGYVELGTLRFKRKSTPLTENANVVRRHKDYKYDGDGRRINLKGDRVGSGETQDQRKAMPSQTELDNANALVLSVGFGVGQLERVFRSNSEARSLLSSATAGPVVACSRLAIDYALSEYLSISSRFLDYRMGSTQLQTTALNEGNAFDIDNNGQLMDVRLNAVWSTPKWAIFGGAFAGLHRHSFQETLPIPVFLSSSSTVTGGLVGISIDFGRATMSAEGQYGIVVDSSQSPLKSGDFNNGTLTSVEASVSVPMTDHFAVYLQAQLYQMSITVTGESEHIDTLTDPNQAFTYTAAEEENRLSTVNIGIHWTL